MSPTMESLRLIDHCVIFLLSAAMTSCFNVTFEEKDVEWRIAQETAPFVLTTGWKALSTGKTKYPRRDFTLRSQKGKYVVADGKHGNDTKILYSACLNPMGPKCALNFHTWIGRSDRGLEELQIYLLKYCHVCGGSNETETERLSYVVYNTEGDAQRWVHHRVKIGPVHSLFVLAFLAAVPHDDSVLALDGLYLESCDLDRETHSCKPDEFQCSYTTQCIPRVNVCDMEEECMCGEDESDNTCAYHMLTKSFAAVYARVVRFFRPVKYTPLNASTPAHPLLLIPPTPSTKVDATTQSKERIPERGRATFQDCDFQGGHCYWYNVQWRDKKRVPWNLVTHNKSLEDRTLPHYIPSGPYVYVSPSSVQSRWSSEILRSVDFPAPPAADSLCAVRFKYWVSGDSELTVQLLELGGGEARTLWKSRVPESDIPEWKRVVLVINNETVHNSYVLQMTVTTPASYRKSCVALTNITLTTECFPHDHDVNLTSCGAQGPKGPTSQKCDAEYGDAVDVTVTTEAPFTGAQVWTVPASAKYSIQAYGARGGRDKEGTDSVLSYGAHVHGKFRLNRGDRLYAVVGQRGEDSNQAGAGNSGPSGAGGGGATFVYKWPEGQNPELLMMAGGGGGLNYVTFDDMATETEDFNWKREWESEENVQWTGLTNQTDFSGRGCHLGNVSHQNNATQLALGGFGAGLGACLLSGGHAGGINLTVHNGSSHTSAGLPGGVYISDHNLFSSFKHRSHGKDGVVVVLMADWRCPCDHLCLWERPELLNKAQVDVLQEGVFVCTCPNGKSLGPDGLSCEAVKADLINAARQTTNGRSQDQMPWGTVVLISIAVIFFLVILFIGFFIYVMRSSPHERMFSLRVLLTRCLRNRSQSLPLTALPNSSMHARVMHINPNYSFITSKVHEQKLPEIPRDNLRMSTELGHGAFGEVYKGFLSGMSGTEREVAVAVKTLPPLCSEQTELDFFMEAFIISKFHHPNIVQFLGVCFEQHPRYIVLELLDGGNLKSFLRENRPPQGSMSKLSVGDLIALAKDVCCACCYLEEHHFIHRDIAARNCLLTSKGPERMAKIADFGMSRDVYRADYYKKEGRALLPLKWMPPEAFMEGMFTVKTDIWSFGVVLWEIFAMGYMPYPALSNTEVMNFIYIGGRLDCPEGCPPSVYDLMQSCWKHKPEERPAFAFIMQTLETIIQDTATMSQHLPAFRLPHLYNGCNGRNLKLLNHPVPDLGMNFHLEGSPNSSAQDALCSDPLLKSTSPYRNINSQASKMDSFSRRSLSTESDSASSKGSCSSLEPLLPSQHHHHPQSETGYPEKGDNRDGDGDQWGVSFKGGESNTLSEKEKRGGHRVKLPPLGHRCDKVISMSSLETLEENDEPTNEEEVNSV